MERPRKQTYTLEMYLRKMRDRDIRDDQKVQRLSGQWNNAMMNELIFSVLNGEYILPIILGQEASSQLYVVDGLQRSTVLMMFRYGGYKITSSLEEPMISYRAKMLDSEGEPKLDGNGDICWETKSFDLRRKTYDKLPEELKKTFNEFQLDCVVHENYNQEQISRLVRRYNHLKPMTVAQKSLTFCDRYARKIRGILKRDFFIEAPYTKAERKNGSIERIILETVMCMFHLNDWKRSGQVGQYINEHSSIEEFDTLENYIIRLENIVADDLYNVFTAKDSFLWFVLFHKFTQLNISDGKFADFLYAFKSGLSDKEVDGKLFYEIDKDRSTKDKAVVQEKLNHLETLMYEYLGVSKPEPEPEIDSEEVLEFVRANVVPFVTMEDVEQYAEVLDSLMKKSNCNRKFLEAENRPSLIAIVAYSFHADIDLDDWIADYCSRNSDYILDQKENYVHMKEDLQRFMKVANAA